MKNKLVIGLLAITSVMTGCHHTDDGKQQKDAFTTTSIQPANDSAVQTYIYRAVFEAKPDSPGVATMTLHMAEGRGKGHFVYKTDYGSGQKAKSFLDEGVFHSETSAAFGTVYVLQGQHPSVLNYQPMDNKLYELDAEKKVATGRVLTGIDPKDSLQSREQILAAYDIETNKAGDKIVWSAIKKQKIDFRDADINLSDIAGDAKAPSAYILFDKTHTIAELFLPGATNGLLLKRTGIEGNYIWTDGHYELFQWKGYVLRYKNGPSIFAGDKK